MTVTNYLKRANELAIANIEEGGQPFGAVLVKEGVVIGEGVNEMHIAYDVSGHAEMIAIRRAQQRLQTDDLRGARMYASGEPCPMCYAAMAFVGIEDVVYSASVEEAAASGLMRSQEIYEDLKKIRTERVLIQSYQQKIGGLSPLQVWKNK
ncbi:nucleoside deaminase [Savagea serpentis]|uniref:nucleoside deaminase n=1 Tax=Savagea serpentis TaxID=2785297 RepID=UPI001BC922D6|nr:nucleoside deaminase [Savagea serpentis]